MLSAFGFDETLELESASVLPQPSVLDDLTTCGKVILPVEKGIPALFFHVKARRKRRALPWSTAAASWSGSLYPSLLASATRDLSVSILDQEFRLPYRAVPLGKESPHVATGAFYDRNERVAMNRIHSPLEP